MRIAEWKVRTRQSSKKRRWGVRSLSRADQLSLCNERETQRTLRRSLQPFPFDFGWLSWGRALGLVILGDLATASLPPHLGLSCCISSTLESLCLHHHHCDSNTTKRRDFRFAGSLPVPPSWIRVRYP